MAADQPGQVQGSLDALAQQVCFSQLDFAAGPGEAFNDDAWDGYSAERDALRYQFTTAQVSNPVILAGDWHTNYLCDVKADFADPTSATVATELVTTSITSFADGVDHDSGDAVLLAENPHIRFVNHQRGYVRNLVTPDLWIADFRVLDYVTTPGSPISTRGRFAIQDGRAGAVPA